ncbi:hypothetical protein [Flavivirga rizhaonensis]|uniref:Hsp20/alpha crystallin family protein n=1 Tax=Flavivirga rizhaonensis TaxID=2559571 RepID=A0A4S1E3R9_9FLAO|nr:hypothetical protein [Flavivirga rizhaonensis]TGV04698.1 hypothetical protein EM932_00805 [Flavivirga rizhaonensis]
MNILNKIKKVNNQVVTHSFPPLRFKKFQMDFDTTGVHILISANFLKRGNYRISVQNGRLLLKIKQPKNTFDFKRNSSLFEANKKYLDFDILLPYKQYQYINSAQFQNNTLQIHLTKKDNAKSTMEFVEAS